MYGTKTSSISPRQETPEVPSPRHRNESKMPASPNSQPHFLEGKTIVVAGGGVAGLAFVAALRQLWDSAVQPPTLIILERDQSSAVTRRDEQSLSLLGVDQTGGLAVLQRLGLLDQVLAKSTSGADGKGRFTIWGPSWKKLVRFSRRALPDLPSSSIRISRGSLFSVLRGASDVEQLIYYSTKCTSLHRRANGRLAVVATDSTNQRIDFECDIVIAADGANSRLRSVLRPDDNLEYAGAVLRGGISRFPGKLPTPVDKDWGFLVSGTGVSCFLSPVGDQAISWFVGSLEAETVSPPDTEPKKESENVLDLCLRLGSNFQEPFQEIVRHTDRSTITCLNAQDKKPFAHSREALAEHPVIFIGDSNHALSPFAGYGANLALCDGWDLAQSLCCRRATALTDAVAAYDAVSVSRAAKIHKASRRRLLMGHSTGWRFWVFCGFLVLARFLGQLFGG